MLCITKDVELKACRQSPADFVYTLNCAVGTIYVSLKLNALRAIKRFLTVLISFSMRGSPPRQDHPVILSEAKDPVWQRLVLYLRDPSPLRGSG